MEHDINFNQADCIKSNDHLTATVYTNVCNGATIEVPYGFWNYMLGAFLMAVMVGTLTGGCYLAYKIHQDF